MIKKLLALLNKTQKVRVCLLVVIILIGGLLETLGVSVIVPIMAVILDEQAMASNELVLRICEWLHVENMKSFTIVLLGTMIVIFIVKNAYLLLMTYAQSRFINNNKARTQAQFLQHYLSKPYEFFLNADIPTIMRVLGKDIDNIYIILLNAMNLLTELIVSGCICIFLLILDVRMTVILLVLLCGVSLFIIKVLKRKLNTTGRENQHLNSIIYKYQLQSLYGIKVVKIAQKEQYYSRKYQSSVDEQARKVTVYNVLNTLPRLLLETCCITGVVLYLIISLAGGSQASEMITTLSAFGVAAIRVLPGVSRINTYLTNMAYCEPSLDYLYENFDFKAVCKEKTQKNDTVKKISERFKKTEELSIKSEIRLENISFAYPNADKFIFDHANMVIPVGKSVGVKGPSGAGKTTVVDILLGLLKLQTGTILCDGKNIMEYYSQWLNQVGYIPQNIYMIDDTISANVAFGMDAGEVDETRIWEVLEEAQLKEFVESLPEGLNTVIGEQGIRISGGQRQRIGIARALYHDPELLVFDEATSALDNDTEAAIMEAIDRLRGRKTMVIIAHRLKTIEKCDIIYHVSDGKIMIEEGSVV